ncbi:MAG: PRC-barrel domain-containing protein [Anaerolineales bacterium]
MQMLSAGSLIGTPITNPDEQDLGTIKELMIDVVRGHVAYAVVDFGGFLGLGNKLFAMPWGMFTLDTDNEQVILDIPKERLQNAEGFDKNDWPDATDIEFLERIYNYYGYKPYWKVQVR